MLKIWAKTMLDGKITRDYMFKSEENFKAQGLHGYLVEICHALDIPTPIVLKPHIRNFDMFNITRFKESDFVERVDFETMVIENVAVD